MGIYIFPFDLFPKAEIYLFYKIHLQDFPALVHFKPVYICLYLWIDDLSLTGKNFFKQILVIPVPYRPASLVVYLGQCHDHFYVFSFMPLQLSDELFNVLGHQPVIAVKKGYIRRVHKTHPRVSCPAKSSVLLRYIADFIILFRKVTSAYFVCPVR
ncbi:hypothetical protein IMSAGC009_03735 [Lachnospiraceae bacterium]|nr:hypothetical protein IMSAGC009_03735 [Lachnospiraceae bacterium]